ncbi:MAG: GFA family protein [Polyangiaceae bacterium]
MSHEATCSCGQLKLTFRGEITRTSVCHCLACQQRTGSVFGVQTRLPKDEVELSGRSTVYVRVGDDGGRISFHFCPECGATVYYFIDKMPDSIVVPVGAFADPHLPSPVFSVYEARKHAWVTLPDSVTEHWD